MDSDSPTGKPVHDVITEAMIHDLVHGFYGKIRNDAVLGPIFAGVIGEDWNPHLAKMCDFWSSVMLMTGRYDGRPMRAHLLQKTIRPEHFGRWLALFEETAREVAAQAAPEFISRAHMIARGFQMGLYHRDGMIAPSGL